MMSDKILNQSVPLTYSPKFLELLGRLGLHEESEIDYFLRADLEHLSDPFRMAGMQEAAARILLARDRGESILIHGDYDVDGVTGAAIIARTLQVIGAKARVFLPHRSEDGYGVSQRAILEAADEGFSVLITVDCGITAAEEIVAARNRGMDVIVIDHHRIPESGLPPANIILNPLQTHCSFPHKELSAGGLAFKLSQALIQEKAYAFLDLAAVSTVCDVAPLKGENRIIVRKGLKLLTTRVNLGFNALSNIARLGNKEINVGHLGFVFGPRINAAGRMSSPEIALRLLMTDNAKEAASLACALDEENKARQKEERQTVKEALSEIERVVNFKRDRVIVVASRDWHPGVIGIVASRLVDRYYRPAIVIAIEKGIGKGSGRSIKGFNLYDAMHACGDLFEAFGGHPQAAGLSIKEERVNDFRRQINEYAQAKTGAETYVKKVVHDMEISLEDLNTPLARELEQLEPHGMGNPRPVFRTDGLAIKTNPIPLTPQTLEFYVTDGNLVYEALWTTKAREKNNPDPQGITPADLKKGAPLNLIYSIKLKNWEGQPRVVLDVKDIELL